MRADVIRTRGPVRMTDVDRVLYGLRVAAVCLAPLLVLLAVGLVGHDDPGGSPASASSPSRPHAVTVQGFAFSPDALTVTAGTSVSWTNRDGFDHSIVDRGGAFRGQPFGTGATFTYKYEKPGTYQYFCGIHNSMTGTVVVTG
jgi:plastocyanin